jgi:predicted molibdopterin-dependent oxidoreductase YjgC
MGEIAPKLVTARGALSATGTTAYNSKGVAFFGSSHMNNESNYLYRKIIANFGTSNVEHQARI